MLSYLVEICANLGAPDSVNYREWLQEKIVELLGVVRLALETQYSCLTSSFFCSITLAQKMSSETYTPGHTKNATNFMGQRTLQSHGEFFLPCLSEGIDILDLGCGPGTISIGLAEAVGSGCVVGIDFSESQIEIARQNASEAGITNLEFHVGTCYELPFENCSFDRIFSHALMEHLKNPVAALKEAHRVLRPEGKIGICSPDADGWLLSPPSNELTEAVNSYAELQASNGGDLRIGKRFGLLLEDSGFAEIRLSARYECYPSLEFIGEYLALQLEQKDWQREANTFRNWSKSDCGMFAQSWVSAIATKVEQDGGGND